MTIGEESVPLVTSQRLEHKKRGWHFHFSGDSLIGEKLAQSGRLLGGKRTLQLHFFCLRLTGGVSLDGCLLLSFLRVPAGEGSVTSDLTTSALDILVLDREKHSLAFKAWGVKLKIHSWTKFAGQH